MNRHSLRSIVAACVLLLALLVAATRGSEAQTWHWTYVTHTPNSPAAAAVSTVNISANAIRMSYTLPVAKRQIVIESCRANLHDVETATTIAAQGTSYLLVRFKANRMASCASGLRPAVALPTNDRRIIEAVAADIVRTCCAGAGARPAPRVSPSPAPTIGTAADPITPARLTRRGSSRLAIGQTGTALVRVTIAPNGTPEGATIVSITNRALTAAAIETAVSSTYVSAKQNGRAIEAQYIATFSFDGEDPALQAIPAWKRPLAPPPGTPPTSAPAPSSSASAAPASPTPAFTASAAPSTALPAPAASSTSPSPPPAPPPAAASPAGAR